MKAKMAAIAVLALILMVIAAPAASAEKFEKGQGKYASAKKNFVDAYSEWKGAKSDFNQAMSKWRGNRNQANFEHMVDASQEVAVKAADMMIRNLEMLGARIEDTRGLSDNEKSQLYTEIDGYIAEIQAKQANIQNASDDQQLREAAGELWRYWLQIRVRIKQIIAEVIVEFAKVALQRVEAFAGRVEARIQELENQGVDTTALESWLADLNSKIELAEQKIADAESRVSQITDNVTFREIFNALHERVKEAIRYLRDAMKRLKDIIKDMRDRGHAVTISGTGTLIAQGSGRVYITGTGTVKVNAPIQGSMRVSPNATVTVSGEGTQEVLGNGWTLYQGYDNAEIVGTEFTLDIEGNGIDIVASGTGTVRLVGSGTYSTYGENNYVDGTWTAEGVSVEVESGEAA